MNVQGAINYEVHNLGGQQYLQDHWNAPETVITTLMRRILPETNSNFRVGLSGEIYHWASLLYGPEDLKKIERILNGGLLRADNDDAQNASNPGFNAGENALETPYSMPDQSCNGVGAHNMNMLEQHQHMPPPSGPILHNSAAAANTSLPRPSTATSTNSVSSASTAKGKRRGLVKEHLYDDLESRIILKGHEEFDRGTLPEWSSKGALQRRLATFITRMNPENPVSANSVLGRYNRMTKPAGKDKRIEPPQKINGQWLASADMALYAQAIGRDLEANHANKQRPSS